MAGPERIGRLSRGWAGGAALALAGVLALVLSAAGAPAVGAPYVINTILPMTGSGAFLGQPDAQALQALERVVNAKGGIKGHPVHFAIQDDQTNPQVGVQLATQIMAKHVPVILGPQLVAVCRAVGALVKEGPVDYCLSPGIHPDAGSYVFTGNVSTHDLAQAILTYFRAQGWTRIAVISSTDASGQDGEASVVSVAESLQNVQIADREHFAPSDVSVSAQIARISAVKPQAIVAWSTGTPIGTVFKGITESGLNIPVATTNGNMTFAQMDQYASFLPRELYIATGTWAAYSALKPGRVKTVLTGFFDALQASHIKADEPPSLAWDPPMIIIDALNHLGTEATAAQIREYIANLRGWPGITGIYDFKTYPQRGLGPQDAYTTRWDASKHNWVPVSGPGGVPLK